MNELHLDLTKDATRQYLRDELLTCLPEKRREDVLLSVAHAGIGIKHFHDLYAVEKALEDVAISDRVRRDMHEIYLILAQAEAQVHGCTIDSVHFHEVGNGEAIENVLSLCISLEALNPDHITATAVQTGSGKVTCAHGVLGIPTPATAAIITRGIPTCKEKLEGELCTPTSAAVILHFVDAFTGIT
jgi:pyridinium-3,5-bisthiocarboxylic acid mononucleotide nickel chelatase